MQSMQIALRLYIAIPKYVVLVIYVAIASSVFDVSIWTAGAWVCGVWFGHHCIVTAFQWVAFMSWGRRMTAQVLMADLVDHDMPTPVMTGEHYLRSFIEDNPDHMRFAVIGAWIGMVDYHRALGQFNRLFWLCLSIQTAVKRYGERRRQQIANEEA